MKVKVHVNKIVEEEVEIEFPFYSAHDLSQDNRTCIHYIKIEEEKVTTIEHTQDFLDGNEVFTLEVEIGNNITANYSYIEKREYHSTKADYDLAKVKMDKFIDQHFRD